MIVRVWRARATAEKAPVYRAHLQSAVFPVLKSLDGFVSAQLLERADDGEVEFIVESRWTSMSAVRSFAGDAMENAVVDPAAKAVLKDFDDQVSHYEVAAECAR